MYSFVDNFKYAKLIQIIYSITYNILKGLYFAAYGVLEEKNGNYIPISLMVSGYDILLAYKPKIDTRKIY